MSPNWIIRWSLWPAAACKTPGKFCMPAGIYAPFGEMVAEGFRVFSVGADVVAISNYTKQRTDVLRGQIDTLPAAEKPAIRSPYV